MKSLPKPTAKVWEVATDCITTIQDPGLCQRVCNARAVLRSAETEYEQKGLLGILYQFPQSNSVAGVTKGEMEALYDERMSKKDHVARERYYDVIRSATAECPLCMHRDVKTLDHYLPKAKFPSFAITPLNLVPACRDCNTTKSARNVTMPEEQTLHPYFDDVDGETWLSADIIPSNPLAIVFRANPPIGWPEIRKARLIKHFEIFELATLYGSNVSRELSFIRNFILSFGVQTLEQVRTILARLRDARTSVSRNSINAALYRAIAESDWFCQGGYNNIAD